jgi:hypothetical protein
MLAIDSQLCAQTLAGRCTRAIYDKEAAEHDR